MFTVPFAMRACVSAVRPAEVTERVIDTAQRIAVEMAEDLTRLEAEAEGVWRNRRATVTDSDEEIKNTLPAFSIEQDGGDHTPFRGGTYELLQALATQQAVKATLSSLASSDKSGAAYDLLHDYCKEASGLFEGEVQSRVAERWLEGLLDLPITMRVARSDGDGCGASDGASPTIVDPRAVCEQILEWRLAIGAAWIERLERLPEEFLEVKREHLLRSSLGT